MYDLNEIYAIDDARRATIERMTFPRHWHLLDQLSERGDVVATIATAGKVTLGFGLAEISESRVGHIHSLFTLPAVRGMGIASAMLDTLEAGLIRKRCSYATSVFEDNTPHADEVKAIFAKQDWTSPKSNHTVYLLDISQGKHLRWLKRFAIRPPFMTVPWHTVSAEMLATLADETWYPENFSPFSEEEFPIEERFSKALLYENEIVGWNLVHRIKPDTVRQSNLFVKEGITDGLIGLSLMAECLRVMTVSDMPYLLWAVHHENRGVYRFVESLVTKGVKEKIETLLVTKQLYIPQNMRQAESADVSAELVPAP